MTKIFAMESRQIFFTLQLARGRAVRAQGLIVVGSLLTNVPNIAGLCRTGEAMGIESLILRDR